MVDREILATPIATFPRFVPHESRTDIDAAYSYHTSSTSLPPTTAIMASPSNLPPIFNPTSQDIEMLLAAQSHLGSKNMQVHMEPYLWKTRPDGINVINLSKTWYGLSTYVGSRLYADKPQGRRLFLQLASSSQSTTQQTFA